jgi:hypothetical protein
MSITLSLAGFPTVLNANVFQGSGSRPGRIIVDTAVVAGAAATWPDVTTLTITRGATVYTWSDIRVIKAPRVRKGYMRTVFEDSRWKLRHATIGEDYNRRDGLGNLVLDNDKTVTELADILGDASGLSILPGAVVPSFKPTMQWIGKTAADALQYLLDNAVCRLVYNPITQSYKIWAAGAGSLPNADERIYRPGPARNILSIKAHSAPVLHEGRLYATAVVDNAAGEIEDLDNYDGDGYFDDFADHAGNDEVRSRLIATAFRLWKLDFPEDKELLPHRALSLTPGGYASAKVIRHALQSQMRQYAIQLAGQTEASRLSNGILFVSDDPILDATGASLATTAEILVGYYELEDNKRVRQAETRTVGTAGSTRNFFFDWIRPIDSDEPDIGTQVWEDVLKDVADALQTKFNKPTATLVLPGLPSFTESGRIGAVQRIYTAHPRSNVITRIALDFDPTNRVF